MDQIRPNPDQQNEKNRIVEPIVRLPLVDLVCRYTECTGKRKAMEELPMIGMTRRLKDRLRYFSHTSGASEREIVPFAIATDGLRWHARAFCRKHQDFRDFVISRMEWAIVLMNDSVEKHELPTSDIQW